jgi:hypothetical protein
MMEYDTLKRDRRRFLALTGLTVKEFQALLPSFTAAYEQAYGGARTQRGRKRRRQPGGGRTGALPSMERRLLFILVYVKAYPLQVVMGELFGLSQPSVNAWIHRLLPILDTALTALGVMPERDGPELAAAERDMTDPADYIIDGTERRRQRPKDPEKQGQHYSGKKKAHTDKNLVVVNTRSKRVAYLGPTRVGKTHDKKLADDERIAYPPGACLQKDTAFQGYEPDGVRTRQPKKTRLAK